MENAQRSPRFKRSTDAINIRKLENETLRLFYLGFVVAIVFHAGLFGVISFKHTAVRVPRPITVELIVRPPRMTRPFVMNKRQLLKSMLLRKKFLVRMPTGKFRYKQPVTEPEILKLAETLDLDLDAEEIASIIAEIDSTIRDRISEEFDISIADVIDIGYDDGISRVPIEYFSLKSGLVSIDDLDTGQYKALVIKDISNRRNLRGYIHIPVDVWGVGSTPTDEILLVPARTAERAVMGLADGFKKHTGVTVTIDGHLELASPDLLRYPFIYISADRIFALTPADLENLKEYFLDGGFALLEGFNPNDEEIYPQKGLFPLRQMIIESLGGYVHFAPVSLDHPLYEVYYKFEEQPVRFPNANDEDLLEFGPYLEGIWIGERLIGIISDNEYGGTWARQSFDNPHFRIGVNMIVFSLIRQGSVARKYINEDTLEAFNRTLVQ